MLIRKGGITRDVDERRLQDYRAKGYEPVHTTKKPVKKE